MIPVTDELNEERTVFNRPVLSPLECLSHLKHIVALDSEAGDDIATCVELSVHGGSLDGSTHAIEVVLADEEGWKVPKFSHVGGLIDLSLVGSTITKHDAGDVGLLLVLECESKSDTNWHLCSNNTISTIKVA